MQEGLGDNEVIIVSHCSDPDHLYRFPKFINEELGIKKYAPFALLGSCAHPDYRHHLVEGIMFFESKGLAVKRVVLVGHLSCKRCDLDDKLVEIHVNETVNVIADLFPHVESEGYIVRVNEAGNFESV